MSGLEKLLRTARRLNARGGCKLPPLIFMTDEFRTPNTAAVVKILPRGTAVIFRHYGDPQRVEKALHLRRLCKERGILFLIANSQNLALRLRADGVHWPEHRLRTGSTRHAPGIITAAAHGEAALRRAERAGADAVLLSPVFATASHPENKALGPLRFAQLAARSRVPVYALGGITSRTAQRLLRTKAVGIAAIGALIHKG